MTEKKLTGKGGKGRGQGRKKLPPEEKITPVTVCVKTRHHETFKKEVAPIVKRLNKK